MGIEKKCFFEIQDISAVHFRCTKCGAAAVVPVGLLISKRWIAFINEPCTQCGAASGVQPDTVEGRVFVQYIDALGKMVEMINGRNLSLSMEIKCPQD
jgi:hypothetical protein